MNKVTQISIYFAVLTLLLNIYSCKTAYPEFGISTIKLVNDTANTRALKKALNALPDQDFAANTFVTKDSTAIPYRLLSPLNNEPSQKYPLIITLHNSTRIGTDNTSQLEPLARIWLDENNRSKYPAFVAAPQFATRATTYTFDQQRQIPTSKPQPPLLAILDLIDTLKRTHNIDENRIYLVGYSMGGSSVIDLLNIKPSMFAAAVAIASVPQFENTEELQGVPIWLIHGSDDIENPFAGSAQLYKAISEQQKTRFWIFEHRTHNNIVSPALLGTVIPEWLFTKTRPSAPL